MNGAIMDDEIIPHRSKKNTKDFCKGKVGVEHDWKPVKDQWGIRHSECAKCGKKSWNTIPKKVGRHKHEYVETTVQGFFGPVVRNMCKICHRLA